MAAVLYAPAAGQENYACRLACVRLLITAVSLHHVALLLHCSHAAFRAAAAVSGHTATNASVPGGRQHSMAYITCAIVMHIASKPSLLEATGGCLWLVAHPSNRVFCKPAILRGA
jgi:hypothetical protein